MTFDGERALETVRMLTVEVGTRFAGTRNERRAAEKLVGILQQSGYPEAALQPFPIDLYHVADESLVVAGLGEVPCEGLLGSTDCPEEVSGQLVYVETGEECEIPADVRGKVLMVYGELRGPKLKQMIRAGAVGVVVLESTPFINPRRHNISHETRGRFGHLPAVRVRHEDAEKLMRARGGIATIRLRSSYQKAEAYNVLCELKGTERPDEIVVVCGHCDSVYDSAGTLDNAGGTAIVVELARLLRQAGSKRTLRFILFSGEEQGLRGSIHYAKGLRKADKQAKKEKGFELSGKQTELDQHKLVVNVDVQGALLASSGAWVTGPADLGASVRLLMAERGPFHKVHEECYSSDNAPLSDAGVPALSFGRGGALNFFGHTDGDAFELCSAEGLASSGDFIARWLKRYVTEPRWLPFERTIPDEHKRKVDAYFRERFMLRLDEGVED